MASDRVDIADRVNEKRRAHQRSQSQEAEPNRQRMRMRSSVMPNGRGGRAHGSAERRAAVEREEEPRLRRRSKPALDQSGKHLRGNGWHSDDTAEKES